MYNSYLEDIVSINSEFIYESILIESNMFSNIVQKIKQLWEKFLNFVRNIKNKILSLIKGGKKEIIESEVQIKPIDYAGHINKLKNINKLLEEGEISYNNISGFVNSFSFEVNYNNAHGDVNTSTTLSEKPVKEVVKTLELRITEAEKILERTKKLLDEKILSVAERELSNAEKENDESKINETKSKLGKITGASNKIIASITKFINQIRVDIEYCYKEARGEIKLPEFVEKSHLRTIDKDVETAREELVSFIFNYYVLPIDKQVTKQKFLLSYAEKTYGEKLYQSDKKIKDEDELLNKINIEYIKKNDISNKEFNDAIRTIRQALEDNFSKRRVTALVGKVVISEKYFRDKK